MPNRERISQVLTQDVVGSQVWDGLLRKCETMPTEEYYAVQGAMEAVVERVAAALDWPRLLAEASARHLILHPEREPDHQWGEEVEGVCGECLHEAFLNDDTGFAQWHLHPDSPREHADLDWPSVVARNLPHRSASRWHAYQNTAP